jgi:hypothetical protein
MAPLVAKALVVPLDLLEFSAALLVVALFFAAFAAKLLVVALELLELAEADEDSVADDADCAPACCALLLVELAVVELLCILELFAVYDEASVVE